MLALPRLCSCLHWDRLHEHKTSCHTTLDCLRLKRTSELQNTALHMEEDTDFVPIICSDVPRPPASSLPRQLIPRPAVPCSPHRLALRRSHDHHRGPPTARSPSHISNHSLRGAIIACRACQLDKSCPVHVAQAGGLSAENRALYVARRSCL